MVLLESSVLMLGGKIFSTLINDTASKIISVTETAIIHNHTDVHDIFTELDLDVRLEVINSLINHIKDENETIHICLKSILDVITEINKITNKIKLAQEEHREKYFNEWRAINVDEHILGLKKQSELLDKRFNLLVNIVRFEDSNITE